MNDQLDCNLTVENPDLRGFDLEAMAGLCAYGDGSGGGINQLAWEKRKMRQVRDRLSLLDCFIMKHQLLLARLNWSVSETAIHPTEKMGEDSDLSVLVPQIDLCSYAYNKNSRATAHEIAALWPEAKWRRSMPQWGDSETERDYTADIDGVLIRIRGAEKLPKSKPVDRFGGCGFIKINKERARA